MPDRWRGRPGRQQELDRRRRVLDDDPAARCVEQRRRGRDDGVDGDRAVGDPEGLRDRHRRDRPGAPGGTRGSGDARSRRGGDEQEVRGVTDPDPVAVERAGSGRTLADEPDDPIGRADLERSKGEPARDVGHDPDRRTAVPGEGQREVTGGGLRRLRVESPGRGHEVAFVGFDEGSHSDRLRRRERPGPEDVDIGLGRADLELAIRRRELAGHLQPRSAGERSQPRDAANDQPRVRRRRSRSARACPRRPCSATMTPVVRTRVPSGRVLTAFSGVPSAAGVGIGVGVGFAVGVAVGSGAGVAVGVGTLVGVGLALGAVGAGIADALGVGIGVGVAAGVTRASSPSRVAWIR